MIIGVFAVVLAARLCSAVAATDAHELYENVVSADTADCLHKVSAPWSFQTCILVVALNTSVEA